jgi:CRISPR-associated protein Cas2
VVYDISSKKALPKLLKICRRFLRWVQKSVFEGELTDEQFRRFVTEAVSVINREKDTILFYTFRGRELVEKIVKGKEKNEVANFF